MSQAAWSTLTPSERHAERQRILGIYRECGSIWRTVRESGRSRKFVRHTLRRAQVALPHEEVESVESALPPILAELMAEHRPPSPPPSGPAPEAIREHTESGDTAEVVLASPSRIRTLEDAIAFAEVDTSVWRVERWSCTSWETGMKLRTFHDNGKVARETPRHMHLWRVRIDLRRILPRPLQRATEAIFETMKAYAPKYAPMPPRKTPARPHLCVVDLFDVHFGKLCWAPETGDNLDVAITDRLYRNAVVDLLSHAAAFEIDQFVLPFGNDFFHVDGFKNETTNGTPQDVDGRFAKIFETGIRAVIWAVEEMRKTAPVSIPLVPGNHDRLAAFCAAQVIAAWFRNCPDVTVDASPIPRKRIRYGKTLIALTHGNEERHASLPAIMATEWKHDWAETDTHEVMLGHVHKSKKTETTSVDTHDGVTIRTLMSLSGHDAWHHRKGYVCGTRAAEAFIYGREYGFVGNFVARARAD